MLYILGEVDGGRHVVTQLGALVRGAIGATAGLLPHLRNG